MQEFLDHDHEVVLLRTDAEPDATAAHAHVDPVARALVYNNARTAGSRDQETARFGDVKHGIAGRLLEQALRALVGHQ